MSPEIINEDPYGSDLHKLGLMHRFDDPENKEAAFFETENLRNVQQDKVVVNVSE